MPAHQPPSLHATCLCAAEEAKEEGEAEAPAAAEYDASYAAQQLPGAEEGYDAYG